MVCSLQVPPPQPRNLYDPPINLYDPEICLTFLFPVSIILLLTEPILIILFLANSLMFTSILLRDDWRSLSVTLMGSWDLSLCL